MNIYDKWILRVALALAVLALAIALFATPVKGQERAKVIALEVHDVNTAPALWYAKQEADKAWDAYLETLKEYYTMEPIGPDVAGWRPKAGWEHGFTLDETMNYLVAKP